MNTQLWRNLRRSGFRKYDFGLWPSYSKLKSLKRSEWTSSLHRKMMFEGDWGCCPNKRMSKSSEQWKVVPFSLYHFGDFAAPVMRLLPGTCCHWKLNLVKLLISLKMNSIDMEHEELLVQQAVVRWLLLCQTQSRRQNGWHWPMGRRICLLLAEIMWTECTGWRCDKYQLSERWRLQIGFCRRKLWRGYKQLCLSQYCGSNSLFLL